MATDPTELRTSRPRAESGRGGVAAGQKRSPSAAPGSISVQRGHCCLRGPTRALGLRLPQAQDVRGFMTWIGLLKRVALCSHRRLARGRYSPRGTALDGLSGAILSACPPILPLQEALAWYVRAYRAAPSRNLLSRSLADAPPTRASNRHAPPAVYAPAVNWPLPVF